MGGVDAAASVEGTVAVAGDVEEEEEDEGSRRKREPSLLTSYLELSVMEPAQKRPCGSTAPSLKRILRR